MNVRTVIAAVMTAGVLGIPLAAAQAPAKKGAAGRVIEMTADDTMKFNVTAIAAKPGEQITIKLTNKGTMPKVAARAA